MCSLCKTWKMITKSLPSTSNTPLIFHIKNLHSKPICYRRHHSFKPVNHSIFAFKRNRHKKHTRLPLLLASKRSNEGDNRAMETVLKLYDAIKNKNLNEISDILGHDCFCVCGFLSTFKTFNGKKQVMEFFSSLMGNLGNNFEFVVQPTLHEGMRVGVSWKLECSKTHKPIGKGFSFHMCHFYEGKVYISNVEMFLEPILHIEPLVMKMVGLVASITTQMASRSVLKGEKKRVAYVLCSLFAFAMLFVVLRMYSS